MTYKIELLKKWENPKTEEAHKAGDVIEVGKSTAHMLVKSERGTRTDLPVGPKPKVEPKPKAKWSRKK